MAHPGVYAGHVVVSRTESQGSLLVEETGGKQMVALVTRPAVLGGPAARPLGRDALGEGNLQLL